MKQNNSHSVTIRDVARRAGLSIATVSRYINHNLPVSDKAAKRVAAAMKELRFVPSSAARKLATHRNFTLGLIITDMRSDFFGPMLHGIEDVSSRAGYDLLISTSRRPMTPDHFPVGPNNTDGLLVFSDGLSDETLRWLAEMDFPMVLIHRTPPEGLEIPCVTIDNTSTSEKIVEHLIDIHHRERIVFLRGPVSQNDSSERERGYRAALEGRGIPFIPSLMAEGEFDRETAHASIQHLLQQAIPFDAVYSGDDEAAIGVITALHEAGLRIPQDVSVVGFDDQRMSAFFNPPLTTVHAPTTQVGQMAAERLLELIQTGSVEQTTVLPTEIVIRRSCGCI